MRRLLIPINRNYWQRKRTRERIVAAIFLLAPLLLLSIFYLLPSITSLALSFTKWDGLTAPEYVGLKNFVELFHDQRFLNSIILNLKVVVISLLTQLPVALFLAHLLIRKEWGASFFRVVFFIPQILSVVAVGVLWSLMYHPRKGPPALLLQMLGFDQINWLGSPSNALLSLMITATWTYYGLHMILQIAGMRSIPTVLYESASLDTNSSAKVFFFVTLPLLRETLLISIVMIVSGSFTHLLGLFWVMTRGGPMRTTELISILIYKTAFSAHKFGYSSAITMVMILIIASIVGIVVWGFSKTRLEF